MRRTIRTLLAGFDGAIQGLLLLAAACAIAAVLPTLVTSYANRGTVDLDSLVPRSSASSSQITTVTIVGSKRERKGVRKALDSLVWSVRSTTLKIIVTPIGDLEPGVSGTYTYPENVIRVSQDVVLDPAHWGLSHVLAHEIGHMLDMKYLDDTARAEFQEARGPGPYEEWRGDDVPWEERPQEDFAEVFAALAAPSSAIMIQTSGGRIRNRAAMTKLMNRNVRIKSRSAVPLRAATLVDLVFGMVNDLMTEPGALPMTFGLAVLCATSGSVLAMQRARYPKRRRLPRAGRRHRVGHAHPGAV